MENIRYNNVNCQKNEGAHYTPSLLANFVSKEILKYSKLNNTIRILDPAIGDGELIISLLGELNRGNHDIIVCGFDINPDSLTIAKKRILKFDPSLNIELYNKNFLETCLEKDNLFNKFELPVFDVLIANPPYIRTQILGAKQAQTISSNFGLKGRIDIYQAFLVAISNVLDKNGVAGVIVSNRFLSIKGASKLRSILLNKYDIKHIWDFGDTKIFKAAVLPAVIILKPRTGKTTDKIQFSSIYEYKETRKTENGIVVSNITDALKFSGIVSVNNGKKYEIKHGHLTFDNKSSDVWFLQNFKNKKWLEKINENTWAKFSDVGKIRVGVKTSADNVFIRTNWIKEVGYEPELLLPLTTHHVAGRFKKNDTKYKHILYPHKTRFGKREAVDIESYPLSKKYLVNNFSVLSARKYLIDANRKWYEIWVPQDPSLWSKPKVIFRDISEKPNFWIDYDETLVNGDCYWIIKENDNMPDEILWLLLAVANSKFIEDFYDIKFTNKLYSNRRRYITQYVEKFPLPNPTSEISQELIKISKQIYKCKDDDSKQKLEIKVDKLVQKAFGLS